MQLVHNIDPSMFASSWIIPLFTTNFPFELCVRFWDIFLSEGWKMCFRLLLAIMQREKHHLKTLDFEETLMYLRDTPHRVGSDADLLIQEAIKINITTKEVETLYKRAEAIVIGENSDRYESKIKKK